MAPKLIHKKSTVADKVPLATDLAQGELAVNLTDQKIYSKDGSNNVVVVGEVNEAGGNADTLDGLDSSSFLRSDANDTATGHLTFTGSIDHTSEYKGIYHTVVEDRYYFDSYTGTRNTNAFLETQRSDIIRYRSIGDIEYWDGTAWQDGSSQLANIKKLLDGRQDTSWSVGSTYYKFRFTVSASTGWPTMALIGMQTSWSGSSFPGCQFTVEEKQADTSWLTKVVADFNSTNGISSWGTMFRADSALHTGRGNQTHSTRITVDFYGWTPSNPSYEVIPLQNIFIFSNYAGTENNDYKSLLDYDKNLNISGNIVVSGAVDGRDVAADGTKLDGIEVGADVTDAANVEPLVDAHLNKASAGVDQVLSWNGSDYIWADASSGGGGGATGGGTDKVFYENDQAVTTDYTITDGQNAMSAGPITINNGVTVTVGDGEVWTVV